MDLRLEVEKRRQYFSLRICLKASYWNPKAHLVGAEHRQGFMKVRGSITTSYRKSYCEKI
ncbi:MAG: hypothetical protein IH951_03630 [Bacteroidetes bacterium]|nr:hypothetical protein [Bacteroidota bacterium]